MSKRCPPLILIAGPTASGKSSLAMQWARRNDGVIVNADASQVYRDIPILSAAPTEEDRAFVEHRLFAFRDGANPCSAAQWADLARTEIDDIHHEGRVPVLVGGTGLYLRSLLDGIAPVPPIDPSVRAEIRATTVAENRAALERLDPDALSRLQPGDRQRIGRALEVVRSTGRTLAEWQSVREGAIAAKVTLRALVLLPPRAWLYERCDRRFEAMLEQGAIEEVDRLLERSLDPTLPVMRAIGVPEIARFLRGEIDRPAMVEASAQATRRYAKRQYTWFRHQPPAAWARFEQECDNAADAAAALALLDAEG